LHRAWQNWTGEEIRERDLAQAQESGREENHKFE
jgi:hypothetical protein